MLVGQVAPLALAVTPAPPPRALAPSASGGAAADYSRELKAAPGAPAPAPFVAGLSATKADSFTDSDSDLKAEPGQDINYEVVISAGGVAATGVQFNDTVDSNTTLDAGSITASPLARDDSYNVEEDETLNVPAATGVLDNDFGIPSPTAVAIAAGPTAQGGTVTLNADGSFDYTPAAGFSGADTFTYTATNGNSPDNGATVTITVGPVDDAPTAIDDTATVNEDAAPTTIDVQSNDTDPDGGTNTIQSVTQPANGAVVITNAGADLTYEPSDNYCNTQMGGTPDTFTYKLNGGDEGSVSVTVTCVDDNPTVTNDAATVNEDSSNNAIDVLANDNDPDGGTNTITSVVQPTNGSVTITGGGTGLTYTPSGNYCNTQMGGTPDSFTYTVNSGPSGTVNVTVTCVDDAPTAVNDAATVPEDSGATTINVQANDTDIDGGTNTIIEVTQPTNGEVIITNAGANLTYQPDANYCNTQMGGTPDSFTYKLSPGDTVATVNVTVTCVDDPPVANDDTATVAEDSGANAIPVLTNDTDIDGGAMNITNVTQGTNGSVTITGGGTGLTYTPNLNFFGSDSFTYEITGGDTATVNVTVTEVNDAPTADDETLSAVLEDSGTFSTPFSTLLAGDTAGPANENTQTLNITAVSPGTGGTPMINGTNVDFTPTANFCGTASFDYTVTDDGTTNGGADAKTDTGTVSFTVTCVNDAPSFTKGPDVTVDEDAGAQTANPWATAISPGPGESDTVSFVITNNDNPAIFSAGPAVSATGVLTFTPAPNAFGVANITLKITDNGGTTNGGVNESATQTFVITVNPVNDAPTADADGWDFIGNTVLEVDATDNFSPEPTVYVNDSVLNGDLDPVEGDPIAVSAITVGACTDNSVPLDCTDAGVGRVQMETDGRFIFTPAAGDAGASETFQYTVTDTPAVGTAASATGTVTLARKGRVWYVSNQATAGGTGISTAPFDTLAEAQTASVATDTIYVFAGDGTTTGQNAGITLKADQRLIGQGVALSMPLTVNGTNPYPLLPAGGTPLITNGSGNAVTITNVTGVEVRGLSISAGAGANNAIELNSSGANNAGATIANNAITGAGAEGIEVNANSTGTTTVDVQNNTLAATGDAFNAANGAAGTLNIVFSNNTGITSVSGNGVVINGGAGTANITGFSGNTVSGATAGDGVSITNARFDATPGGSYNTVNAGDTEIGTSGDRVGGAGLLLTNVTGDLNFNTDLDVFSTAAALQATSPAVFNGSNAGLRIQVNPGVGALNSTGGPAIDASKVQLNLSPITVVSSGSTTYGVNFDDTDGSAFSTGAGGSSISSMSTAGATAFRVTGSTGTYTYNGTITTTGSKGVDLTTNTGATISFTNDLVISSGAGTAFNATGGGTVSVTDTPVVNTLTTTTATALNVANTTIGSNGLKFKTITSSAPTGSAIVLNNTGTTAGLSVLGDGTNDSGGSITNAGGDAISLTNTQDVSLTELNISNPNGSGVNGTQVTNFSITNSTITDAGDAGEESGVAFNTSKTTANNIDGTLTVTGNTITNAYYSGVDVQAGDGTITQATISNNVITTTTNGFGINFVGTCTSSTCLRIDNADLNQNNITNPRGAGIQVQVSSDTSGTQSPHAGLPNDASKRIDITNNSIDPPNNGTHAIAVVTGSANPSARAKMNFLIECNGNNTAPCSAPLATPIGSSLTGHVILVGNNGHSDMVGVINNNEVTANHTVSGSASNAISGGNGVSGGASNTPDLTLTVTNNVLSGMDGNGILLVGRGTSGTAKLKITGNNVGQPLSGNRGGIRVDAGNAASVDDAICLNINGNTTLGSGVSPGINIYKQGASATINDFGIVGFSPPPAPNWDDAENDISADNVGSELGTSGDGVTQKRVLSVSGTADNFTGCSTAPAAPVGFETSSTDAPASDAAAASSAARRKATQDAQSRGGSRGFMDEDPRPGFGLVNGKFVVIPEGQTAPTAAPARKAPAVTSQPTNNPPAVNAPAVNAPAAAPRTWSDIRMPIIINSAPRSDSTWGEDPAKDDEDEEKAKAEQNDTARDGAAETSDDAQAAPKKARKPAKANKAKKPAEQTEEQPAAEPEKQTENRNISYLGPLGSAASRAPRFVNASYSPAGDARSGGRRQAKQVKAAAARAAALPAAAAACAPAPNKVCIDVGDMGSTDTVTIRFKVSVNTPFSAVPEQVSNQGTVTATGGITVQTDDPSVGGATDQTVTPVDATRFISVNDAKAVKPTSPNTVDMTFTVALSAPAPAAITVNFQTDNGSATAGVCNSGGDYSSTSGQVAFAAGEQVKTINVPICGESTVGETLLVNLSGAVGGTITDSQATGTITAHTPGTILISELRTSGPGGAGDDFVELYNNTDAEVDISGYGLFKMGAACNSSPMINSSPVLVAAIPGAPGSNTTKLPARGHYLLAGSAYSLKDYGGTDAAKRDQTLLTDLEADANVGIFSTSDPAAISSVNRLDAVGFGANVGGTCNLLREPSNLPGAAGSTTEHTYFRKLCDFVGVACSTAGNPKDTGDNSADFTFANTDASVVSTNPQKLGAPGPENLTSPVRRDNKGLTVELLDREVAGASPPNRTRTLPMGDPVTETFGSITIRRRVVNNTGSDVHRLRFRIIEFTTKASAPGVADLRALTSTSESSVGPVHDSVTCFDSTGSATTPCTVAVAPTTLEMPPAQAVEGGGLNSTLSAGTILLGNKLLNGKSINVSFKLGVHTAGTFRFYIIVEALP